MALLDGTADRSNAVPLTAHQIDVLTRTVLGEALPNDPAGQAAVAWSIINRSDRGNGPAFSRDPAAVALAQNSSGTHAYSAWNTKANQGNDNVRLPASSPQYQSARQVIENIVAGNVPDPTGGATFYYAPNAMTPAGSTPSWAPGMNEMADIGHQLFFSPTDHPVPPSNIPNSPPPLPRPSPLDTRNASYSPVPLAPMLPLPGAINNVASTPALPSPPSGAPPATVTVHGRTYQVGSILSTGGNTYKVQPDGTFVKAQTMPIGTNTIASGLVAPIAQNTINTARAALPGMAASAGATISGLFGHLFGGNGSPAPSAPSLPNGGWPSLPPPPTLTASVPSQPDALNGLSSAFGVSDAPPSITPNQGNSLYASPPMDVYASTNGGSYSPPNLSQPVPGMPQAPRSVPNPAYTAWLNNTAPIAPQSPFSNPGVQGLSPDDRDAVAAQRAPVAPPPPKYLSVPVPQPMPVMPLSPPPAELAALRQQAMNPLQRLFAATPLGNIGTWLNSGGYGAPTATGLLGLLPPPRLPPPYANTGINNGPFASAGNNNASAARNMTPGGSLTGAQW